MEERNVDRNRPMKREMFKIKFMICIFLYFSGYWFRTVFVYTPLISQKTRIQMKDKNISVSKSMHMQNEYIRMRKLAGRWWYIPLVPALGRLTQADLCEVETSLLFSLIFFSHKPQNKMCRFTNESFISPYRFLLIDFPLNVNAHSLLCTNTHPPKK